MTEQAQAKALIPGGPKNSGGEPSSIRFASSTRGFISQSGDVCGRGGRVADHHPTAPRHPQHAGNFGWGLQITLWLWFTVVFANFAEAMAEGRGKAQADTLRKARSETVARRWGGDVEQATVCEFRVAHRRCGGGRGR